MYRTQVHPDNHKGMTLLELMVALAIGSVLLIGLATVFFNSSRTHRELEKSGQMIENGRYAINLLYDDLRHAGYYGYFFDLPDAPLALPDPCETASDANLKAAMALPIQGYNEADTGDLTTCGSLGLSAGSDILVLRRADTAVFTGAAVANEVYLQANGQDFDIFFGDAAADVPNTTAENTAPTLLKFPSSVDPLHATLFADTFKYHVHVYYVAGGALPTLNRLELTSVGGATSMQVTPLVEGIQYFKVEYGIDDNPSDEDISTNSVGDGIPDRFEIAPVSADWPNVVSVRVYMLARNIKATDDYNDSTTYTLAGADFGPFGDKYKRHVFSTEVRFMDIAGRREIPK